MLTNKGKKLEINNKMKTGKHTNMWRLKNMVLNNQGINKGIKQELKNYFKTNDNENTNFQNYGFQQKQY